MKAVRLAGYEGPLVGLPWQAPAMLPHYYNLRSDYLVGYIDRHNYFGGGLFDSMLAQPGQRLFLQRIAYGIFLNPSQAQLGPWARSYCRATITFEVSAHVCFITPRYSLCLC